MKLITGSYGEKDASECAQENTVVKVKVKIVEFKYSCNVLQ